VVTAGLFARVFETPFQRHREPAPGRVLIPAAGELVVTHQQVRTLSVT
jgi:hypothetical protein